MTLASGSSSAVAADGPETPALVRRQVDLQPQRALDRHLPIAEGGVVEDPALLALLEGEEGVADALDVLLAELAVLLAQVLAQGPVPPGGVDQLHLAPAVLGLAVAEHPDVGGDAGVVEHVERQGDDRLQPVVLDDPAADVALALAGVAGEQGAAVVDLGDAAAARFHLGELVGEEEHLAVAGAGDQGVLGIAVGARSRSAGSRMSLLPPMALQVGLPALAVRWIGEHEVELAGREGVVGQGGVLRAAHDVVGGVPFPFEQQVGLADGVGLGIDLLAEQVGGDLFAVLGGELLQHVLGHGQHAAGAAGPVVDQVGAGLDLGRRRAGRPASPSGSRRRAGSSARPPPRCSPR